MASGEALHEPLPYVVHGSFRRHLDEIGDAIETINASGMAVALAPHDCVPSGERDGFVLLAGEEDKNPLQVEAEYLSSVLASISRGGFSLFVDPDGYVGRSAAYEAGIVQASGGRAIFTEQPLDVPFYVDPANILSPVRVADLLVRNNGVLPRPDNLDPIARLWESIPFNTAAVAVGGVVLSRGKVMLVQDGRWEGGKLTVPGTTVRAGETRDDALRRAFREKFGIETRSVSGLKVGFMEEGSGYGGPVRQLVFDDREVTAASPKAKPKAGITAYWLSRREVEEMLGGGQVEPNAAALLASYLARA